MKYHVSKCRNYTRVVLAALFGVTPMQWLRRLLLQSPSLVFSGPQFFRWHWFAGVVMAFAANYY